MKTTKSAFPSVLAIVITVGFFFVLLLMIFRGGFESTVNILVGALAGSYVTVVSFNFSSTRNSQEKTEMIYNSKPIPKQDETVN
ncbi:MAG: hypothetical protein WCI31_15985 [Prolixibacteraceae bacterium]